MTGGGDAAAGNRAVSALFRVFGGPARREYADGIERAPFRAMHSGERLILGWVVPLTVLVALSEWLVRWMGPVAGWLSTLPLGIVLLNLLASFIPGRRPIVQWLLWLSLLTAWAVWRRDAGGYITAFSWLWIGIFVFEGVSHLILLLGISMRLKGWPGMLWRIVLFLAFHAWFVPAYFHFGWLGVLAVGGGIAGLLCASILRPTSQWLGPVTLFREGQPPLITIDDGPCPQETPALLDLLDRKGVKAVFFVIGEKVKAHPELAREIVRRGHELGNHTMTHPQTTFWCGGPWRTRREIIECQKIITAATGVTPRWFRAPVGHRNLFTHPVTSELGLEVMGWSRRGYDAVEKDAAKVLDKILPVRNGDIVLMHEGTGIAVEVLKGLVQGR